jgi:5-methylcytosine-specific restriction endonuclease McrA
VWQDFEALALGHRWPREADLNLEEELDIFMPLTSSHKRFRLSRTLAPTLVLNGDGINPVSLFPLSLLHWEDALAGVGRRRMQIVKVYERISDLARQLVPSVVKLTYMAPRRDIFKELPIPRPWKVRTLSFSCRANTRLSFFPFTPSPSLPLPLTPQGNIALRDLYKCSYCGTPLLQWDMTLDHVIPRSRGGDNSWENLASCCFACNQRKGDLMPSELQKVDMSLRAWPREPTCIDLQRNYLDLLPKYVVEQWTHILRAPMDEATRIVERRTGLMREHRAPPIVCSEIQQHVARGGL